MNIADLLKRYWKGIFNEYNFRSFTKRKQDRCSCRHAKCHHPRLQSAALQMDYALERPNVSRYIQLWLTQWLLSFQRHVDDEHSSCDLWAILALSSLQPSRTGILATTNCFKDQNWCPSQNHIPFKSNKSEPEWELQLSIFLRDLSVVIGMVNTGSLTV